MRQSAVFFVLKLYSFAYNPKTAGYEKLKLNRINAKNSHVTFIS